MMQVVFIMMLMATCNFVRGTLPPGYEDEMWCAPDECSIYVDLGESFDGPASMFRKCYNAAINATTNAIWTGYLSESKPPNDYIVSNSCDSTQQTTPITFGEWIESNPDAILQGWSDATDVYGAPPDSCSKEALDCITSSADMVLLNTDCVPVFVEECNSDSTCLIDAYNYNFLTALSGEGSEQLRIDADCNVASCLNDGKSESECHCAYIETVCNDQNLYESEYGCNAFKCCTSDQSENKEDCFESIQSLYKYEVWPIVEETCTSIDLVDCFIQFDPYNLSVNTDNCVNMINEECADPLTASCFTDIQQYKADTDGGIAATYQATCDTTQCLIDKLSDSECECVYATTICISDPPSWLDCELSTCCAGADAEDDKLVCLGLASPFIPEHHYEEGNDYVCVKYENYPLCLSEVDMGTHCVSWECDTDACGCEGGRAFCETGVNPCDKYVGEIQGQCSDESTECLSSGEFTNECASLISDECSPEGCISEIFGLQDNYPICQLAVCLSIGRTTEANCKCDYVEQLCSISDSLPKNYNCDQVTCCAEVEERARCFEVEGEGTETIIDEESDPNNMTADESNSTDEESGYEGPFEPLPLPSTSDGLAFSTRLSISLVTVITLKVQA